MTIPKGLSHAFTAAALGLLTLLLRLGFLFASKDRKWPHSVLYEGDAPLWVEWLKANAEGRPFEYGLPIHSPAVTWVLGLLTGGVVPQDFTGPKVIWCICSALTVPLVYLVGVRTVGRAPAIVASLWAAFAFHASVLATSLNGEVLYTLALMLIVLATSLAAARTGPMSWLLCAVAAVIHGLAILIRAEHTLLLFMLCALGIVTPRWLWRGPVQTNATPASSSSEPHLPPRHHPISPLKTRSLQALMTVAIAISVCLPWSIQGTRATNEMNKWSVSLPNYDTLSPVWTADARAYMDTLPPFVRNDNAAYLSSLALQARQPQIDADRVRQYFLDEFAYIPEPLKTPVFVSSQGPMSFALANHPASGGGFSRAAFDARFGPEPNLTFALPSHLKLYNRGFQVGIDYIRSDPGAWLSLVGQKLIRFEGGITGGLGQTNFPLGRTLLRYPVDLAVTPATSFTPEAGEVDPIVPPNRSSHWWRWTILGLLLVGSTILIVQRQGTIWLVIILYKLIVTVAFYGYARQSASILPAFAILICVALAFPFRPRSLPSQGTSQRPARLARVGALLVACALVGLSAIELIAFSNPKIPTVEGQLRPPRTNADDGAFECFGEVLIRYESPPQTTQTPQVPTPPPGGQGP